MPLPNRQPVVCRSATEAVSHIQSHTRVFLHEFTGTPQTLFRALTDLSPTLQHVTLSCFFPFIPTPNPLDCLTPAHRRSFQPESLFCGPSNRKDFSHSSPHSTFFPLYLHELPQLLSSPDYPLDAMLLTLSPPDRHGFCSLGASVGLARSAVDSARLLIAEINESAPRTLGNTMVHYSHLDYVIATKRPLPQLPPAPPTPEQQAIGRRIAALVPDGACVQAGIGGIPDAALAFLKDHRDLGVHIELAGDGIVDLIRAGAVTGRKKSVMPGKVVACFAAGTEKVYGEVNDNPMWYFDGAEFTNDPGVIARNEKVVAINSALEVDLTGQVCADTMGRRQFGGVGGQVDFVRGAGMSEGGIAIIALPSTAMGGKVSRIVPSLAEGASVTTARWHGAVIVTEFGAAELWGKNTRQRADALIEIAHPRFREELAKKAAELYGKA